MRGMVSKYMDRAEGLPFYHALYPLPSPVYLFSLANDFSAFSTTSRRIRFSISGSRFGSPVGWTMLSTGVIRVEPTIAATEPMAQICATGNPILSNSLTIADPQRVLVPQVEVRMAPETPAAFSSTAIASPIFLQFSTMLAQPEVE